MIEVKCGIKTIDLPFMIQVYDVTEEMFDELVDEDTKAELIDGVMIVHSPASMEHDDFGGFIEGVDELLTAMRRGLGVSAGPRLPDPPRAGPQMRPRRVLHPPRARADAAAQGIRGRAGSGGRGLVALQSPL